MIEPVSEDAVLITLGQAIDDTLPARISQLVARIRSSCVDWLVDLVPAYTTLLVIYDPILVDYRCVVTTLRPLLNPSSEQAPLPSLTEKQVELPVYYSPESGPDLQWVASETGLTCNDVIKRHTAKEYRVHALGFAPGFGFLGEVDLTIALPRKTTPRKKVPAGSVGIANQQTAVYPQTSPGGWQLIGLCPTPLFDTERLSLLKVGDRVRFKAISREQFLALGGQLPQ